MIDWERDYLQERLANFQVKFIKGTTKEHGTIEDKDVEALCFFVDSPIDKKLLDQCPSLKLLVARSTGLNNIDMDDAVSRGVKICYVPSYGKNTVAEYTFGLMIMVLRKLYEAYDRVRDGNFSRKGLCGVDLCGKTLGVIGTGDIGSRVVRIGTAFGMKVLVFDINIDEMLVKETGCKYISFDNLLAQSDIITLHLPYNKSTHHMINMNNIGNIKKGSFLINTARGPIVETAALVKGLQGEILAGAGLDVLEEEGVMGDDTHLLLEEHPKAIELQIVLANHYLINHPRVIVTAHNAFNTFEARKRILDCTIDNIKAFAAGTPINILKCA